MDSLSTPVGGLDPAVRVQRAPHYKDGRHTLALREEVDDMQEKLACVEGGAGGPSARNARAIWERSHDKKATNNE